MKTTHLIYGPNSYGQTEDAIPGLPVRLGTIIGSANVSFRRLNDTFSAMRIVVYDSDGRQRAELDDPTGNMDALGVALEVSRPAPAMIGQLFGWYDPGALLRAEAEIAGEEADRAAADLAEAEKVKADLLAVIQPLAVRYGLRVHTHLTPVEYAWGRRSRPVATVRLSAYFCADRVAFDSNDRTNNQNAEERIRTYCANALTYLRDLISPSGWLHTRCGYDADSISAIDREARSAIAHLERAIA